MCREMGREDGSGALAEDDDVPGKDVARVGQVRPGCQGIGRGEAFGRVAAVARAKAAIVEGEDVDAKRMEGEKVGDCIGEVAASAVKIENRVGCVLRVGGGGDPPGIDAGFARDREVEIVERNTAFERRAGNRAGGMEEELPLALVEEEAEGSISAKDSGGDGDEEGGDEPASADNGWGFGG